MMRRSIGRLLLRGLGLLALAVPLALGGCGGGGAGDGEDDDDDDGGGGGGVPVTASVPRGAQLYEAWWTVVGTLPPSTRSPSYPTAGTQTGAATWRCAECHGWDYKGATGQYGSGAHYTGIAGVLSSASVAPATLFASIDGAGTSHDFSSFLAADDVWDLVAFVRSGALDPSPWISSAGVALGDASAGSALYAARCASCHGADGSTLDLGGGDGVGERADAEPWRVLHKIRWGAAGTAMPSMQEAGLSLTQQSALLAYCQSLAGTTPPPPPPPPPPVGLSYANDVAPIWSARACTACHGGSGGMTLSGSAAASYAELFEVAGRVDKTTPSQSLILRKPLTGSVSHGGGKFFATTADADYQKILTWIAEGALNN